MNWNRVILFVLAGVLAASCSTSRTLLPGEYRLAENEIRVDNETISTNEFEPYLRQKASSMEMFGWNPMVAIYNLANPSSNSLLNRILRRLGQPPVVYDPASVDGTISSMMNHLEYLGYYGSSVESNVQVRKRDVRVLYSVHPGRRYPISEVKLDLPEGGEFSEDFMEDAGNITLKKGDWLSASALEAEANRSSAAMRNKGYYTLTSANYFFEADTLTLPGTAALRMSVREYPRSGRAEDAVPLRKYCFRNVSISHEDNIRINPSALADLNLLRPGQQYSEDAVNDTYARFSSLNVFSSVNMALSPVDTNRLDCDISLRHSSIQGVKLNFEGSTNSSGLYGLSPQLTYYHKNIFHGGERLNIGLKGIFQFNPDEDVKSTEFGATVGISFPKLLGLDNAMIQGPVLPRTDISAAFNYQNRPEYRMSSISAAFGYSGSLGNRRVFYQLYPFQANVVRVFDISETFYNSVVAQNPYMLNIYQDHFDLGVGGTLQYTTDASASPQSSYHYYRAGLDLSGNLLGLFNPLMARNSSGQRLIWGVPYSQYMRVELQVGRTFVFGYNDNQALATRLFAGIGYAYGNSVAMPYEKLFYVGGASSMRGWQARTLGPGNAELSSYFLIPNQTGAMKLEADLEYRFGIISILKGAVFAEAGNVWDINPESPDGQRFTFATLPESVALDWGFGLRLDLKMILIRVDMGLKVHDPAEAVGSRWIQPKQWLGRDNRSIHFGIGYPF